VGSGAVPSPSADTIGCVSVASPETYLADLNPAQREAVLTTEGPLLVIAGAGSGKTRVLTYRVAHLLRALGAKPPEILAITFTNKAANEMKERLERLIGPPARALWVMTFHAACGRIFRREAERLGYRANFTIYDSQDQQRLVKSCLEELGKDPKRFAGDPCADLEPEEPARLALRCARARVLLLRPDRRRGL
jgi:DNA helicase II / ATP-dependent DNA helicase PcrA